MSSRPQAPQQPVVLWGDLAAGPAGSGAAGSPLEGNREVASLAQDPASSRKSAGVAGGLWPASGAGFMGVTTVSGHHPASNQGEPSGRRRVWTAASSHCSCYWGTGADGRAHEALTIF